MKLLINTASDSRRGSAMIAGIFVVLVISTLSMSYLQLSMNRSRENATAVDSKRAFYMAEAGLAEGYAALVSGKSGVVGSPEEPAVYANGVFWVEATPISSTRTQLHATGLSGTGRDSLTVVVERTTRTLAEYGVFGDEGVRVGLGATIDTYDSRLIGVEAEAAAGASGAGAAAAGAAGAGAVGAETAASATDLIFGDGTTRLRVGSNQDITFVGDRAVSTVIEGDVIPGPGGSVVMGAGVSVTGSTAPAEATVSLGLVDVPATRDGGSFEFSERGGTHVHEAALCLYNTFKVTAGKVVIEGPAKIAINQLYVAEGAELEFDTSGGPIRLYVGERLVFATGSTLSSVEQDPTQLMIALSATDRVAEDGSDLNVVTLGASGEFYGFIYSPLADLRLTDTLDYYGTMVGKELTIAPGATLHFDEALLDVFSDGSQIATDLLSWRFVELPETEIVRTRVDPIKWMKIKGKTLSKPSESHDDDWDGRVDASDRLRNRTKEAIVN